MKVLVYDNYDSFTYNLVQLAEKIVGKNVTVLKNDAASLEEIDEFDKIILSPGPGLPSEAGNLLEVIQYFADKKPVLGVCLGQQAIAEAFGGNLIHLNKIFHGVATCAQTTVNEAKLLRNLPQIIEVGRYHSWAVDPSTFPQELEITSVDEQGMIMSLQHKKYDLHGVQYHPESILTPLGSQILSNFLLNP